MWLLLPLYFLAGLLACIAYRWSHSATTDGQDILLDVLLWPIMVYYWMRYGKGL